MFGHTRHAAASGSLRALSALLGYPDASFRGHLLQMREVLHGECALSPEALGELDVLITALARSDPFAIEANYVALFDSGRATSLHLFEHVHGDSRERGPAMIDLAQTFEKAGLFLAEGELPDFLPVVLEFVSTQPRREASAFLQEMAHIFNAIFAALQRRESPYAAVLGALLELAGETARPVKPVADQPLDESWAEPVVFDGCSTQGQRKPVMPQPIRFVPKDELAKGASA